MLPQRMTALILAAGFACLAAPASSNETEKPFLEGAALEQALSGVTLSGEYRYRKTWSGLPYTYEQTQTPGGQLQYSDRYDSDRKGWWTVEGPRACFYYADGETGCFHVFTEGNCYFFVDDKYPPASRKWMIQAVPAGETERCE